MHLSRLRPRPRRPRSPRDLTDTGDTFEGFGHDPGVWRRPDHLDEPDSDPALDPLDRLGAVGSSAVAVLSVVGLVVVLVVGFGHSADHPTAIAREPARPAPVAAAAPVASAPEGAAAPAPDAPRGMGDVVVLDQARTPATSRALAGKLKAAGWRVTGTGAWHGRVPATTVYHPAGQEAAAKRLAAAFPEVRRIKPTFPGISQARLVVIVVDPAEAPLVRKVLGTETPKAPGPAGRAGE